MIILKIVLWIVCVMSLCILTFVSFVFTTNDIADGIKNPDTIRKKMLYWIPGATFAMSGILALFL